MRGAYDLPDSLLGITLWDVGDLICQAVSSGQSSHEHGSSPPLLVNICTSGQGTAWEAREGWAVDAERGALQAR